MVVKVIHRRGIEWTIKSFNLFNGPELNGTYPMLLLRSLASLGSLNKIFKFSIVLRYIPQIWRNTKIVFISKPARNGHILAKDDTYQFNVFSVKVAEKLVDKFLRTGPLIGQPLAFSHYAYKGGRSTKTVLHYLVSRIEVQLTAKGYALDVFLDIEGAFDSTSNILIKKTMDRRRISDEIWTLNIPTGRFKAPVDIWVNLILHRKLQIHVEFCSI